MKTLPKTPRLLPALVVLFLAAFLCLGHPARAQGQWYPGYVPCYADGTPVPPAMMDGNGFEVMAGTLTGRPAGGQSIPYAQYGRYLYSFNPNSPSVPDPFPYDPLADSSIPGLWVSSRNGLLSSDGPDVSVTSGASGQVQVSLHAYFLWKPGYDCDNPPSGPPPPPPPTASFLLQTQLSASYSASYQRQPFASGPDPTAGISAQAQVQDGYGELAQVIAPAPPYPYSYGSYGVNGTAPAGGLHLVTVGVQTVGGKGIYTINLSGSAQAQAANSLNGANFVGEASATATLNGGARHDDRAVTISADVDPTFKKSPRLDVNGINYLYDQWGNIQYQPTINLRDSDGTMHGDVGLAAQPEHVLIPTPSDSALYITYRANRSGGWHIGGSQDWWYSSLTGVSANDMLTYPTDISTFVISYTRPDDPHVIAYTAIDNDPIYSQPLPGQTGADHVHLTYQDAAPGNGGDAAVATANYYMNVHDRGENPFKFRPDEPFWKNVTLNTPIPKANFLLDPSVTVTGQADGATTSGDMIGSAEWTLAFNAMPGWLQGVLKVAGVDDYSLKPTPVTGTVPFDGVWHSPIDVGATWDGTNLKPADTEEPFYEMTPRVQQYYVHTWTRTDHYVPPGDGSGYTGFAGQQDQQFDVRSTAPGQIGVRGTGDFSRISKP